MAKSGRPEFHFDGRYYRKRIKLNDGTYVVGNSPKELIGAVENAFSGQNWGQNTHEENKISSNTNEKTAF